MLLKLADIWQFVGDSSISKDLSKGENLFKSGHILLCRRVIGNFVGYKFVAYCERDSTLHNFPYEIRGKVNRHGKIINLTCNCEENSDGKCQHAIAALLYCNSRDIDILRPVSEQDLQCPHGDYNGPTALCHHKCFGKSYKDSGAYRLTEEQEHLIKDRLFGIGFETVLI